MNKLEVTSRILSLSRQDELLEVQKALNDLGRTVRVPSHKTQTEKQYITSIHKPVGEEGNKETYADRYLKAEPMTSDRELKDMRADILRILAKLPEKQRIAITMFYGIGRAMTLGFSKWEFTRKFWNSTIEPWFIDLVDNTVGGAVRGFIRGLRID